jgi:predicted ATP-grasp superfamily ATP-dependent carboligase
MHTLALARLHGTSHFKNLGLSAKAAAPQFERYFETGITCRQ